MSCKCRTVKACQQSYQYFTAKSSLCSVHQSPEKKLSLRQGRVDLLLLFKKYRQRPGCKYRLPTMHSHRDHWVGDQTSAVWLCFCLDSRLSKADVCMASVHVKCISIVCHQCQRKDKRLPILSDTSILSGWLPCLLCISLLERLLPLTPLPQLQVLFAQLCVLGSWSWCLISKCNVEHMALKAWRRLNWMMRALTLWWSGGEQSMAQAAHLRSQNWPNAILGPFRDFA